MCETISMSCSWALQQLIWPKTLPESHCYRADFPVQRFAVPVCRSDCCCFYPTRLLIVVNCIHLALDVLISPRLDEQNGSQQGLRSWRRGRSTPGLKKERPCAYCSLIMFIATFIFTALRAQLANSQEQMH